MAQTIVVLAEEPLVQADVSNLVALAGEETVTYFVVIPGDRHKNLLAEFFHHLSLLEFTEAFRELSDGQPTGEEARSSAENALQESLSMLGSAGLTADGSVGTGNAIQAMVDAVGSHGAQQAVVVTRPHALADTFHTDWANQAQDKLGIPVLHLYAGSGFIGDS